MVTPGLYRLIDLCMSPDEEGIRFSLVNAATDYVDVYLEKASRAEVVAFLGLLFRTELTADSPRLKDALVRYVDTHLAKGSRDVDDVATFILKRGAGETYARRWLGILKKRLAAGPRWSTIDVLAELPGLLPATDYSPTHFFVDVRSLANSSDFEVNVEARRHKWARLNVLAEEILRPSQLRYKPNGSLDSFIDSLEMAQTGGET